MSVLIVGHFQKPWIEAEPIKNLDEESLDEVIIQMTALLQSKLSTLSQISATPQQHIDFLDLPSF